MIENTRGGLIPYHIKDGVVHVCLMIPSDPQFGGPDWQFAKGHIEHGESESDCAVREAIEELGLKSEEVCQPWHVTDSRRISWWAAEVTSMDLVDHSYESADARWYPVSTAFEVLREWQAPFLSKFIGMLGSKGII